ncbi:MAG: tetratricopeptide repeat protein [Bacteroidia bacterium]|nr:tetratricopeptide repeat protein [Bacteroidia bacterium]
MKKLVFILLCSLHIFHISGQDQEISGSSDTTELNISRQKKSTPKVQDTLGDITTANNQQQIDSTQNYAESEFGKGNYREALDAFCQILKAQEQKSDSAAISSAYYNIGNVYDNMQLYNQALPNFIKSLEIKKTLNDKPGMSKTLYRIGDVYYKKQDIEKALDYYTRSLELDKELKNDKEITATLNNIGVVFYENRDYENAEQYYENALKLAEDKNMEKEIAFTLNNLGNVNFDLTKYNEAINYYEKSLDIKNKLNLKKGVAITLHNIGNAYKELDNFEKAIECYNKSNTLSAELELEEVTSKNYYALADIYNKMNNCTKSLDNFKLYASSKYLVPFSLLQRQLSELHDKFESGSYKKEQEITYLKEEVVKHKTIAIQKELEVSLKNSEISEKEAKVKQLETQKIAFITGLILFFLLLTVVLIAFIQKRKANRLLARQKQQIEIQNSKLQRANEEITAQKDEITTQRDEIATQRDLVTKQKEHIEEQKKEITDSINYAKRIQQAVLPDLTNLSGLEWFVLFRPKDIVSGDFYWATRINEWLIVTVADCTGHGVPGAFMSMLGVSFLNEIVRKKEIIKASQVLENLRESIIDALQQKGKEGEQQDGMDIAFCAINTTSRVLQYAGAKNPLYIVETRHASSLQYQLTEIKADKIPVGIYINMEPFTHNEILLNQGDIIYLASDGYIDQFGGENRKKLLNKRFKEILIQISNEPMNIQKEILEQTFENWKGENAQIDDVTVLGLKI